MRCLLHLLYKQRVEDRRNVYVLCGFQIQLILALQSVTLLFIYGTLVTYVRRVKPSRIDSKRKGGRTVSPHYT